MFQYLPPILFIATLVLAAFALLRIVRTKNWPKIQFWLVHLGAVLFAGIQLVGICLAFPHSIKMIALSEAVFIMIILCMLASELYHFEDFTKP